MTPLLRIVLPEDLFGSNVHAVDADAYASAAWIVEDVRKNGRDALLAHAVRFGDVEPGTSILYGRGELEDAERRIDRDTHRLLSSCAARIEGFARAQLATMSELRVQVPGGHAGHRLLPIEAVGCYAPGGRHPLVSSVLMTVIPARVAGVARVVVATPKPSLEMMAAAAIAGADELLAVGGAQAIAALAYGVEAFPRVDMICGPGNAYVTAAKKIVFGDVGIDMLAGPSELVVLADASADAELIAADLLAQAEHDPRARPILVTTARELIERVERALDTGLQDLATSGTARAALEANGCAVLCRDLAEATSVCNRIAPEHLELFVAEDRIEVLTQYGGLFVGSRSAEVFGDYGIGPNHVLPTGGTARYRGGLSVFDFVRSATWLELDSDGDDAKAVAEECAALARLEGLEGHARAALLRHGR